MGYIKWVWVVLFLGLTGCVGRVNGMSDFGIDDDNDYMPPPQSPNPIGWGGFQNLVTGQGSGLGTEIIARPIGPLLQLQADFPVAGPYTVAFNITTPTGLPAGKNLFMAEAIVRWKVKGFIVQRRVSIANGVTVSGEGQGVEVIVWDTTPTAAAQPYFAGPFVAGTQYVVSAQVTKGTRATKEPQPILTPPPSFNGPGVPTSGTVTSVAPGIFTFGGVANETLSVPIPQDAGITAAKVLYVNTAAGNAADPEVQAGFFNTAGFLTAIWQPYSVQSPQWMPIPPGSNFFQITNGPTGNSGAITLYYAIDG